MQKQKAGQISKEHTVIVGLGKATHHMLSGKEKGEPHVLSERGSAVLRRVKERYDLIVNSDKKVHVMFAGGHPNYTMPQKLVPLLRDHVPTVPQAEMLRNEAIESGVNGQHVTAIPKGTDMLQNLVAAKNHFRELGVKPKLEIFVDGHQARRAEMVARQVFKGYELEVRPVYAQRSFGMGLFENLVYEPVETVYMWAGAKIHNLVHTARYGKY